MLGFFPLSSDTLGSDGVAVPEPARIVSGWGRGAWGQGPWNQNIPIFISSPAAQGSVGSVTVPIGQTVNVSGLLATTSLGSVLVFGGTGVAPVITGVSADATISSRGVLVWGRIPSTAGNTWRTIAP
jgi:hypothetical protein